MEFKYFYKGRKKKYSMIAKFYTNSMFIMFALTLASFLLSVFATGDLSKAAFLGATGLSAGALTLTMAFAKNMKAKGNKYFSPINFNVWGCIIFAIVALATVFTFQDLSVFKDTVFENVVTGTISSGMAAAMAFARKDSGDEQEDTVGA